MSVTRGMETEDAHYIKGAGLIGGQRAQEASQSETFKNKLDDLAKKYALDKLNSKKDYFELRSKSFKRISNCSCVIIAIRASCIFFNLKFTCMTTTIIMKGTIMAIITKT